MGHQGQYMRASLSEIYNTKTSQQSFIERMSVLLVKQRISVSEPTFLGDLGVTYAIHLLARWKADRRLSIGYN